MNICILGSGIQGRVVAQDLAESNHQVTVIDNNQNNLKKNVESLRITTKLFDVTNKEKLIKFIEEFDIVVGALPSNLGFYLMKCAIKAGVDLVDLSYAAENPFLLDKQAKKNKVRIVPDAGFAPGLSNILIGEAHRELGKIDNLRILVGGIPQNPHPPFNYKYTWSPSDLIAEYTRPARILKHHKFLTVEALSGIENFSIPKIGTLECFYTDGLRTLLHTFKDIQNIEEKTIRYAGHAELMKELLKYGFLPNENNPFTNDQIKPKDFILDFLNKELSKGDDLDLTVLLIDIKSRKQNRRYTCIDYYEKKDKTTSMARMTGYTCSIIVQYIKDYYDYGVIPPEYIGMTKKICDAIKKELTKRHIKINTTEF